MNIQTHTVEMPQLFGQARGWGNGYIGVPPEHPWHGKHYNDIYDDFDVSVYGGLTYSGKAKWSDDTTWWLGFDTAHWGDGPDNCSQAFVEHETEQLKQQALAAVTT